MTKCNLCGHTLPCPTHEHIKTDNDFDVCWCGHTRIQHGILSPELCNFCKECSGFTYDIAINSNRILNEMQDSIQKNTITDSDARFERQAIMDDLRETEEYLDGMD